MGRLHLGNDVHVPILRKGHVGIRLGGIIFSSVKPIANVTGHDGSHGQFGGHFIDINLILVLAQGLVGIVTARFNGIVAQDIFAINNLIDNT